MASANLKRLEDGKLYYSISEVCSMTGLEQHVLRYWESEFPQLRPKKNRSGNRAYRLKEIKVIRYIKFLLYEEMYTIPGAKRKMEETHFSEMEGQIDLLKSVKPPANTSKIENADMEVGERELQSVEREILNRESSAETDERDQLSLLDSNSHGDSITRLKCKPMPTLNQRQIISQTNNTANTARLDDSDRVTPDSKYRDQLLSIRNELKDLLASLGT